MRAQIRTGFTLVELMVAMALTLFIMVILTQAFTTSLETFAAMKGIGDMQVNLRTACNIIRDDLKQDHFEGKRRLSDLVAPTAFTPLVISQQPQAGFFTVLQGSGVVSAAAATSTTPYVDEGMDANGVHSYRARDQVLYMTVKRKGNRQENFFSASLQPNGNLTAADLTTFFSKATAYDLNPTTQLPLVTWSTPYQPGQPAFYSSQWAEVAYYLVLKGSTEEPNNPKSTLGIPIFALYRAQFVMVPDGTNVSLQAAFRGRNLEGTTTNPPTATDFGVLSCGLNPATAAVNPNEFMFYSPADAARAVTGQTPVVKRVIPTLTSFNRNPQVPLPPIVPAQPVNNVTNRVMVNEALLLPSVISFHVQVMPTADAGLGAKFVDVAQLPGATNGVYDTANFGNAGFPTTGLKAIQITLRVWDNASRQTRQVSIVQDL